MKKNQIKDEKGFLRMKHSNVKISTIEKIRKESEEKPFCFRVRNDFFFLENEGVVHYLNP